MELDDVGVLNALDNNDFLGYHLFLFFGHVLYFDHLDSVLLNFALLAAFEDFAGGPRPNLFNQLIVPHFL
jgi:hypothetical protein